MRLQINTKKLLRFCKTQGYNDLVIHTISHLRDPMINVDGLLEQLRLQVKTQLPQFFSVQSAHQANVLREHRRQLQETPNLQLFIPEQREAIAIKNTLLRISQCFPVLHLEHRIKTITSMMAGMRQKNPFILCDRIGFRIVTSVPNYLLLLQELLTIYNTMIAFTINTFRYDNDEICTRIGRQSRYYRAIHIYLYNHGKVNTEIQLMTPALYAWVTVSHDTTYKPVLSLSNSLKTDIARLGAVANYHDFLEFLAVANETKTPLKYEFYKHKIPHSGTP